MTKLLGSLGVTAAAGSASAANHTDAAATSESGSPPAIMRRIRSEMQNRIGYTRSRTPESRLVHESNSRSSERAVVAKFGKGLPHDLATGLPTTDAYGALAEACETGAGFDSIPQPTVDLDRDDGIVDEIELSELVDDESSFSTRPLVQPETGWSYATQGRSPAQFQMPSPPAFDSVQTGAEMVELYWRALTRDVPFREYPDSEAVRDAIVELDGLEGYHGPGSDADSTADRLGPRNVFRGVVPGAQTGPYVSQFLLKDRLLGRGRFDQRIRPQLAESTPADYMTDVDEWLKIQRGVPPAVDQNLPGDEFGGERRYITSGRDLAERVHEPAFRQLQEATQVLLYTMRVPLDDGIPYTMVPFSTQDHLDPSFDQSSSSGRDRFDTRLDDDDAINGRQTESRRDTDAFLAQTTLPFNDFGQLYVEKKMLELTDYAQKVTWHEKWNVHRRLRPEEYGGRVEAAVGSDLDAATEYPIPDNLRGSEALEETARRYDSFLLPQAYAEGSPTHPSYPGGHSVAAGAGATLLKAFFDGDYVFSADEKVIPNEDGTELLTAETLSDESTRFRVEPGLFDELTVRGELNKLAANISLGRNRAGIHYRSDGLNGMRLGEAVAIDFIEDQLTLPAADSVELSLETFDGEDLTVRPTV